MPWTRTIADAGALLLCLAWPARTFAQDNAPGWLEQSLHAAGKMNTVIAVVAVVLIGLLLWMASLDRRLRKAEKRVENGS
ncbi:MAG: hypothetical protein R2810_17800 [Flavobacteriales bacterium]|nr:hypothetical protein [Flavobacteriales bacterium]MCB9200307.1 CcmD family protein [Flavobacteriales bacterium]HOP43792.1 hypothetical protein [Flavobacteriales bacterium]HPF68113.1 hypothetical protein [Flavobacteriales bacterium]HPQ58609.1 hypothetical protein [Flavobacteriales bacterium]